MNVDLFDDILCNEEIPIELEINDVIELDNIYKAIMKKLCIAIYNCYSFLVFYTKKNEN